MSWLTFFWGAAVMLPLQAASTPLDNLNVLQIVTTTPRIDFAVTSASVSPNGHQLLLLGSSHAVSSQHIGSRHHRLQASSHTAFFGEKLCAIQGRLICISRPKGHGRAMHMLPSELAAACSSRCLRVAHHLPYACPPCSSRLMHHAVSIALYMMVPSSV